MSTLTIGPVSISSVPICLPRTPRAEGLGGVEVLAIAEKFSLLLAFAGTAWNWVYSFLISTMGIDLPSWLVSRLDLVIVIPAVILGIPAWRRHGGFGKSPAMLCTVAVLALGLTWTPGTELGRGFLKLAAFAATPFLAALIAKHRYFAPCIAAFVAGSCLAFALVVAMTGSAPGGQRFGTLIDDIGAVHANPNNAGGQAAIGVLLLFAFPYGSYRGIRTGTRRALTLLAGASLLYFLLLTASRTAFLALAGAVSFSLLMRLRRSTTSLFYTSAVFLTLGACALLLDAYVDDRGSTFYGQLAQRLFSDDTETVSNFGSRWAIWDYGIGLLNRDYNWALGFGTGGVDRALGTFFQYKLFALGRDGIHRLHSHSTYIEWMMMLGAAGTVFAGWLLISAIRSAWKLDKEESTSIRTGLLVFAALYSFGGVITTEVFWSAYGSLLWALLSMRCRSGGHHSIGGEPI